MRGADKEESADKSAERSGANLEGMVTEEEATTAGGGRVEKSDTDGNGVGDARYRIGRATWGHDGQRG